jgi:N-acetylglutamate synthase-like GNAT family acetyltransferase
MSNFKIRKARRSDIPKILSLIKELAHYEKALQEVKVTANELERDGFGKKKVYECFVASSLGPLPRGREKKGKRVARDEVVGMAIYYIKYSTWKGRCIYLDDIIVTEKLRGKGIGKLLFDKVIETAKKMKVRKLEWQVLNWNKPAINFYKKYNTVFDNEWINCKLVFE